MTTRTQLGLRSLCMLIGLSLASTAQAQSQWRGEIELDGRPTPLIAYMDLQQEYISMRLHMLDFGLMNLKFEERESAEDGIELNARVGGGWLRLRGDFVDDTTFGGRWLWGPK